MSDEQYWGIVSQVWAAASFAAPGILGSGLCLLMAFLALWSMIRSSTRCHG